MDSGRVVFTSVIEGLYVHALRGQVTSDLKARLRKLGLDLDQPLPTALSVLIWEQCLHTTAEVLSPGVCPTEALWRLGSMHVSGLDQTLIGRAMFALFRMLGPHRALAQLTRAFRTADNYSELRLTPLGPARCELWWNATSDLVPYAEGLMTAVLARCGAQGARVTGLGRDETGIRLLAEWDA